MSRFDEIEAILTALGASATTDEVELALRDYPDRDVRAVLAERSAATGGSGLSVLSSGDLFVEDYVGEFSLFAADLATVGTVVIRAWAVWDWDFTGDTWLDTGILTELGLELILKRIDDSNGTDLVAYDVAAGGPNGSGSLVEFEPLPSGFPDGEKAFNNCARSAVVVSASTLLVHFLQTPTDVTGRYRVYAMIWTPPA